MLSFLETFLDELQELIICFDHGGRDEEAYEDHLRMLIYTEAIHTLNHLSRLKTFIDMLHTYSRYYKAGMVEIGEDDDTIDEI